MFRLKKTQIQIFPANSSETSCIHYFITTLSYHHNPIYIYDTITYSYIHEKHNTRSVVCGRTKIWKSRTRWYAVKILKHYKPNSCDTYSLFIYCIHYVSKKVSLALACLKVPTNTFSLSLFLYHHVGATQEAISRKQS